MRVLQLHCSEFSYIVKKETPVAEQPPDPTEDHLKDVLACFVCFEKKDETRIKELIKEFTKNIKIDISRLGCNRVLIYPYAHLSPSLGSARLAKGFLVDLKKYMTEKGIEVYKSPFGWYKAFKLNCIGHPLSEAYREL